MRKLEKLESSQKTIRMSPSSPSSSHPHINPTPHLDQDKMLKLEPPAGLPSWVPEMH